MDKKISTTALAKEKGLTKPEVDSILSERGFIARGESGWELTSAGTSAGGEYKESDKYGTYITWPSSILDENEEINKSGKLTTATEIGKHFQVSRNTVNPILSELGWVKKGIKGWVLTEQGKNVGGHQKEHPQTGIPYVIWTSSIITNNSLARTINEVKGADSQEEHSQKPRKRKNRDFVRNSRPQADVLTVIMYAPGQKC